MYFIALYTGNRYDTIGFDPQCKAKCIPGTVWMDGSVLWLAIKKPDFFLSPTRITCDTSSRTLLGTLVSPKTCEMMAWMTTQRFCQWRSVLRLYHIPKEKDDCIRFCEKNSSRTRSGFPRGCATTTHATIEQDRFVYGIPGTGQQLILFPSLRSLSQWTQSFFPSTGVLALTATMTQRQREDAYKKIFAGSVSCIISTMNGCFVDRRFLTSILVIDPHDVSYQRKSAPRARIPECAKMCATIYGAKYHEGSCLFK